MGKELSWRLSIASEGKCGLKRLKNDKRSFLKKNRAENEGEKIDRKKLA